VVILPLIVGLNASAAWAFVETGREHGDELGSTVRYEVEALRERALASGAGHRR
jgi:hypothetical protein